MDFYNFSEFLSGNFRETHIYIYIYIRNTRHLPIRVRGGWRRTGVLGVKLFFVVVGSSSTVGVFGEWAVSTSLSAHPHGTTQQTQVYAALACKHAKEVTPTVRQQRGPGSEKSYCTAVYHFLLKRPCLFSNTV